MILEKVKLATRIKEEDITEDLARRLRGFSDDILASDIQSWKRVHNPAHKHHKKPKVSIIVTFHEESPAQKLCEISERTKRVHELSRSLTKKERDQNSKQWILINSKNMSDPNTDKVWLPEFHRGVIINIKEYPDTLDRRQKMKDVVNAKLQGKDYLQMIPDPPF